MNSNLNPTGTLVASLGSAAARSEQPHLRGDVYPATTSVRLVTNPERMVLRETQRTFVYFSLHGLTVDAILVNRLLPGEVRDVFFREWRESQSPIAPPRADGALPSFI